MASFAILTDSTSDMSPDLLEKYNIDYCPMNYTIDDKEYPALLDWSVHTAKEFYDFMRQGIIIKTTQVPVPVFEKKFEEKLKQGLDVLYVACSSALSGSYATSLNVAKDLMEKYPGRKVCCVDSLISSFGEANLAIVAFEERNKGKDVDEVASYLESIRLTRNQFATVENLEYLKRCGRVSATSAFFGNFFGIHPLIISDKIGQNYAIRKIKGAKNVIPELAAAVKENVVNPENQILYISHADNAEQAIAVRDAIMEEVPFKDSHLGIIGPIVGASVGPGTISVYVIGKEVTVQGGVS
ncbi:MAG: DegV family protein [Lachnospiraceae bacterium]|nr:DegV family protein [Lachnospiraceae bacterium]